MAPVGRPYRSPVGTDRKSAVFLNCHEARAVQPDDSGQVYLDSGCRWEAPIPFVSSGTSPEPGHRGGRAVWGRRGERDRDGPTRLDSRFEDGGICDRTGDQVVDRRSASVPPRPHPISTTDLVMGSSTYNLSFLGQQNRLQSASRFAGRSRRNEGDGGIQGVSRHGGTDTLAASAALEAEGRRCLDLHRVDRQLSRVSTRCTLRDSWRFQNSRKSSRQPSSAGLGEAKPRST